MHSQFDLDLEKLEEFLEGEKIDRVKDFLKYRHPSDVAYLTNHIAPAYRHMLVPLIKKRSDLDEIVYRLNPDLVKELVLTMQATEVGQLFDLLDSDDAVKVLDDLPEELVEWVMLQMPKKDSQELDFLMHYEEDQAGRIMSTEYFAVHEEATVFDAFTAIRQSGESDMIYTIYVIDDRRHLVGVFSLRELLSKPNHLKVREFMNEQVVSVKDTDEQESVSLVVERLGLSVVPVVNSHLQLVGIVTLDDVLRVIRSVTTEDIMRLAGTTEEEYSHPSPLRSFLRRMPWLLVSFFGGMITIQTNLYFSSKVPHLELLAFVTIIAGMGGNIASQSSTIVVRGLATGKILTSELWEVMAREVVTGLFLGMFFGALLGAVASFEFIEMAVIGGSVAVGMVFSMLIAAFVGTLMPMLFQKAQIDPAIATGPFVSTTIDNLGLLGYYSSTLLILRMIA